MNEIIYLLIFCGIVQFVSTWLITTKRENSWVPAWVPDSLLMFVIISFVFVELFVFYCDSRTVVKTMALSIILSNALMTLKWGIKQYIKQKKFGNNFQIK